MSLKCPYCKTSAESGPSVVRRGYFWRKSDGRSIARYKCKLCKKGFSSGTHHPCYRQNKRHLNERLRRLLVSGVSQRQAARIMKISRHTVVRKFLFLAQQSQLFFEKSNLLHPPSEVIEFDDMETFEHTKLKPLSVTLAVEFKTRRFLGFTVSSMPAKGRLARLSVKKYGRRRDERRRGRLRLFAQIKPLVHECAVIKSDQNPFYPQDVKKCFPKAEHVAFKGQRGSTTGQGELKKVRFDPLFSLNHTCAMSRAHLNRLFRKTWCTTKKRERLFAHLMIYAHAHNQRLMQGKLWPC